MESHTKLQLGGIIWLLAAEGKKHTILFIIADSILKANPRIQDNHGVILGNLAL